MSVVYGIDLGTTHTVLAKYTDGQFSVVDIDGEKTLPSVVSWNGEKYLVGRAAVNYSFFHPDSTIRSIKRKMGDGEGQIQLGSKKTDPVEISSVILKYLMNQIAQNQQEEMQEVVITVPAYFNELERKATLAAGKRAGLKVLRLIHEPTAAGLVYEMEQGQSAGQTAGLSLVANELTPEKWMVYDLGGGTFDVTLLEVRKGYKEVLASSGDNRLGGDDFDLKIVEWLVDWIKIRHQFDAKTDPITMAHLALLAPKLKIELSVVAQIQVNEMIRSSSGESFDLNVILTRSEFEEMIAPSIAKTFHKCQEALRGANTHPREITRLLLVGGSTRIPMVAKGLFEEFGLEPCSYVDPDLSVALGASMQAALIKGLHFGQIIVDVSPHTLGLAAWGKEDQYHSLDPDLEVDDMSLLEKITLRHPKTFVPIIKRNTKLPAKFVEVFYTVVENQKFLEVAIYQGEEPVTMENLFVGSFRVSLRPTPEGSAVYIGLEYNLDGMIQISVNQEGDEKTHHFRMDINQSATANIDPHIVELYGEEWDQELIEVAGEGDDEEFDQMPRCLVNLLVKQMEEKILALPEGPIRGQGLHLLDLYRQQLNEEDDQKLDILEEKIYDWIESLQ